MPNLSSSLPTTQPKRIPTLPQLSSSQGTIRPPTEFQTLDPTLGISQLPKRGLFYIARRCEANPNRISWVSKLRDQNKTNVEEHNIDEQEFESNETINKISRVTNLGLEQNGPQPLHLKDKLVPLDPTKGVSQLPKRGLFYIARRCEANPNRTSWLAKKQALLQTQYDDSPQAARDKETSPLQRTEPTNTTNFAILESNVTPYIKGPADNAAERDAAARKIQRKYRSTLVKAQPPASSAEPEQEPAIAASALLRRVADGCLARSKLHRVPPAPAMPDPAIAASALLRRVADGLFLRRLFYAQWRRRRYVAARKIQRWYLCISRRISARSVFAHRTAAFTVSSAVCGALSSYQVLEYAQRVIVGRFRYWRLRRRKEDAQRQQRVEAQEVQYALSVMKPMAAIAVCRRLKKVRTFEKVIQENQCNLQERSFASEAVKRIAQRSSRWLLDEKPVVAEEKVSQIPISATLPVVDERPPQAVVRDSIAKLNNMLSMLGSRRNRVLKM